MKVGDYDGLYVYVSKSGSRLWRFKFRHQGKEGVLSLGRYPDISLAEARELRDAARTDLAKGLNPSKIKQTKKALALLEAENTFATIAEQYLAKKKRKAAPPLPVFLGIWIVIRLNGLNAK